MSRIVVGVDGSEHSARAVRWAVEEARLRGAKLEIVHATPNPGTPAGPVVVPPPPAGELRAAGLDVIEESVSEVDTTPVAVERTADSGTPAGRLCRAARGADLLVVGSRGSGGFRGLRLGSVAQQVLSHAPCPVAVIVPEDR